MHNKIKHLALLTLMLFGVFSFLTTALAQSTPATPVGTDPLTGLDSTADKAGLKQGASTDTGEDLINKGVGNVISNMLGIVGALFLILTIYAGIMWMSSGGNDEKVGQAKKILIASVIGIVIIFAAFVITQQVIEVLS